MSKRWSFQTSPKIQPKPFAHRWIWNRATTRQRYISRSSSTNFTLAWNDRNQPNVGLFHYADLEKDLPGEMMRLAEVLRIDIDSEEVANLAEHGVADCHAVLPPQCAHPKRAMTSGSIQQHSSAKEGPATGGASRSRRTMSHYRQRLVEITEGDNEFMDWLHQGFLGDTV